MHPEENYYTSVRSVRVPDRFLLGFGAGSKLGLKKIKQLFSVSRIFLILSLHLMMTNFSFFFSL